MTEFVADSLLNKWAKYTDVADPNLAIHGGTVIVWRSGGGLIVVEDQDGKRFPTTTRGTKAHNASLPGSDSISALVALATSNPQTLNEGNATLLRVSLSGDLLVADQTMFIADTLQAAGHSGHVILGVRRDVNTDLPSSTGRYAQFAQDRFGRLLVADGVPLQEPAVTLAATAAGNTQAIAAPGATQSIYLRKGSVHNGGTAVVTVSLRNGTTAKIWEAELAVNGGGSTFDFGSKGERLTLDTALNINLSGVGTVKLNVTDWFKGP